MSEFDYIVVRRPKRRTLCIRIKADNDIEVLAPRHVSDTDIARFVVSKSSWIRSKQTFNTDIRAPYRRKHFEHGEAFPLLGCDYPLQLICSEQPDIECAHGSLKVKLPDIRDKAAIEQQIERWYRVQAQTVLKDLCDEYSSVIGVQARSVGIKNYRCRWGSCHRDGRIYFNWRIIMAPETVVRYVVVHELCHLLHANHSKLYWQTVARHIPDYRRSTEWLKINGLALAL